MDGFNRDLMQNNLNGDQVVSFVHVFSLPVERVK